MYKLSLFDIRYILIFFLSFLIFCFWLKSLEAQDDVFQLSGIVSVDTTTEVIANAHVYNLNRRNVSVSNQNGFFTIVVGPMDTLRFTSIGYQTLFVPISETNDNSLIVSMQIDTTMLQNVVIYPLPGKAQLKWALMDLDLRQEQEVLKGTQLSKAGFVAPPAHPEPPPPSIMNPISLFYEKVIKQVQKRKVKKNLSKTLPKLE